MDQKKEKNGGQESVVPEKDYKEAYEQEHYKSTYLAGRVAELEDQVDDLQFKLGGRRARRCANACILPSARWTV